MFHDLSSLPFLFHGYEHERTSSYTVKSTNVKNFVHDYHNWENILQSQSRSCKNTISAKHHHQHHRSSISSSWTWFIIHDLLVWKCRKCHNVSSTAFLFVLFVTGGWCTPGARGDESTVWPEPDWGVCNSFLLTLFFRPCGLYCYCKGATV